MSKSITDVESTAASTVIDLNTAAEKTVVVGALAHNKIEIETHTATDAISQRSPSPTKPYQLGQGATELYVTVSTSRARSESFDTHGRILEFLRELLQEYPPTAKYPPIDDTVDHIGQNDVEEE